ncbi:hypothetical protein AUJ95_06990 [Candidatus Desantisbacteria bacterium CG2_30_40_21]|uniref:Uncharacterized protein n=3 Tax=unclassified Candidatus Desantisiibacteriota TaxID=3106372 RepID=A0A2M7P1L2_9BACT|nr:MAG: hypothetical protein AUJ95_06990 [Candidatus Desantisbacteria bacterium CG2_30_40_21]PIP39307.1 MAG: hypothetical protein COX18_10545 [Candidatus Desantisbacteria bacterium CG23_combo_of_CG06-09_8_20_14_all_40_23]PIY19500.1 MAG: hypothetical protein COZ13_04985 [Candidatus Desantisbacteria bacterium CG_4_10_14_3_um_filter_40_18]
MKIIPIAFDSLGTRSMATFVETDDIKIVIDPSVALGKERYGLPPHPMEIERESLHWAAIRQYSQLADVLIVTHYHYDHHNPSQPDIFRDKIALLKHPKENINKSQQGRAAYFLDVIGSIPDKIEYSDGREFEFGNTRIKFSQAVPHGNNDRLGFVTEVSITDGNYKLVHTSDIEGGNLDCQRDFILRQDPDMVIFDGPMTYPYQNVIPNIVQILKETRVTDFIIDHHYLRNLKWREKMAEVFDIADRLGKRFICAAQFLGRQEELFEARRKQLYSSGT